MDVELSLAIGATLMCFSIPALVSASIDGRFPFAGVFALGAGAGLIGWVAVAIYGQVPGSLDEARMVAQTSLPEAVRRVPESFIHVTARVMHYFGV